jgi:hypothetical protein
MADKPLPEGWRIVSLHYADDREPKLFTTRSRPSDRQIAGADAIRVGYTPSGGKFTAYRTIHGASSIKGVGDLIDLTVKVVSPV